MKIHFSFVVTSLLVQLITGHPDETITLFSRIIKKLFHEKIICHINDENSFNYLVEEALVGTEINVISISYNNLKHITVDLPCTGYIVTLSDGDDFLRYYSTQKENTFVFKPWKKLLLIYEKPPRHFETLYRPVLDSAIDIMLVELPKRNTASNFFSYNGILVKSLYTNSTILSWSSDQSKIDWTKFGPIKWTPMKANLRVSFFHCPPFMYVKKNGTVTEGLEYRLIREVIKTIPIKPMLVDGGNWSAASDMVEGNASDVAVCSQWHINSKGKNIDFTYPIKQICCTFLVKKPTLLPDSSFVFQPLQAPLYLATIVILMVVFFLLVLSNYIHRDPNDDNQSRDLELHMLYLTRTLSMGGAANLPIILCSGAKFLLGFWYLYCVIFSTCYSAGMTSCLTKPRYTNNIDTLQNMADYRIQWFGMDDNLRDYFRIINTSLFTALADLYVKKKRITERSETSAIAVKIIDRRYVTDIDELPNEARKYYKTLSDCVGAYYMGFVLQKNSPLTKLFDETLIRLVESGIHGNWVKRVLDESEQSQRVFFSNYVEEARVYVNVKKIQGAFYVLITGYILSLICFLIEFTFGKSTETLALLNRI